MTLKAENITFAQKKLDVLNKKRVNLFNWRGQFTPEFIEYLLDKFGAEELIVLDPFSGSGTVLFESARKNIAAYGFEINPAGYAMSQFYSFCQMNLSERKKLLQAFEETLKKHISNLDKQNLFSTSYNINKEENINNLSDFSKKMAKTLIDKPKTIILLNILFLAEKQKKVSLPIALNKAYIHIKKSLLNLPYVKVPIQAYLDDARNTHKYFKENVDLIITSPPYINVFNYHQNYRSITETFGFQILKVAQSEFGANRKNRGNRFKTVVQYCLDMEQAIYSFWHSLKVNGMMILIVGRESNVRKTPFLNGQIVIDIIENMNIFSIEHLQERSFYNKFGKNIKEDIIIVKKKEAISLHTTNAKKIARKHLKRAYDHTSGEIKDDISKALLNIDRITASPLFDATTIKSI